MTIGKVTLTKEQADEIKDIKDIAYAIEIHSFNKRPDKAIAELSTADLARALLIGYDIEPKLLKVGDRVVVTGGKNRNMIGMLLEITEIERKGPETRITFKNYALRKSNQEIWCYLRNAELRHATPEEIKVEQERRLWKSIGREVGEFREGDIYIDNDKHVYVVDESLHNQDSANLEMASRWYRDGGDKGFYPAESFISFGGESDD